MDTERARPQCARASGYSISAPAGDRCRSTSPRIASVGIYEHGARAEFGQYIRAVMQLLRPGGLFLNHGITRLVPQAPRGDPFIELYVFPDRELQPVTDIMTAMQATSLEVCDVESLRQGAPHHLPH